MVLLFIFLFCIICCYLVNDWTTNEVFCRLFLYSGLHLLVSAILWRCQNFHLICIPSLWMFEGVSLVCCHAGLGSLCKLVLELHVRGNDWLTPNVWSVWQICLWSWNEKWHLQLTSSMMSPVFEPEVQTGMVPNVASCTLAPYRTWLIYGALPGAIWTLT